MIRAIALCSVFASADIDTDVYSGGKSGYDTNSYPTNTRDGVSSVEEITAPTQATDLPYDPDLMASDQPVYDPDNHDTEVYMDTNTGDENGNDATQDACTAKGMLCDFKDYYMLGEYDPMDFFWKPIAPEDYDKHPYEQQTLSCQVKVSNMGSSDNTRSTTFYDNNNERTDDGPSGDYFYVKLGQENTDTTDSADYCDIEAMNRTYDDAANTMTDTIRIRGETSRLTNNHSATNSLIGEYFDVICKCEATLDTEVALSINQDGMGLIRIMNSTGGTRELRAELILYSDEKLENIVDYGTDTFPKDSQRFYFLAKHNDTNDWDVELQISKCVACAVADNACTTYENHANGPTAKAVVWWQNCTTMYGGPQYRPVHTDSWYLETDATVTTDTSGYRHQNGANDFQWSDDAPGRCPYHAIGVQKFRMGGSNLLRIACRVVGCTQRPCASLNSGCGSEIKISSPFRNPNNGLMETYEINGADATNYQKTRRSLLAGSSKTESRYMNHKRQLQQAVGDGTDATLRLNLGAGIPSFLYGSDSSNSSAGVQAAQIVILILALIIFAGLLYATRKMVQKRQVSKAKNQGVRPHA